MCDSVENFNDKIEAVSRLFKLAEEKLKMIEHLDGDVLIPSINELRYAGCHLVKSLVSTDGATKADEAEKAIKHCKRSIYDALEVGIVNLLEKYESFQSDYRMLPVQETIPNYLHLKKQIRESWDFILKSRNDDRVAYWEQCSKHFLNLKDIMDLLEDARTELNVKVDQKTLQESQDAAELRREISKQRYLLCGTILASLSLLVTLSIGYKDEIKNCINRSAKASEQESQAENKVSSPHVTKKQSTPPKEVSPK